MKLKAFNVFLNGKLIDTIFYNASDEIEADDVKRSLVNHDGYDSRIVVRENKN